MESDIINYIKEENSKMNIVKSSANISKNINFVEAHKGIDDVDIEAEILLACFAQHKKMDTKPYSACWRLVQKKRSEMGERLKTLSHSLCA